MSIVHRVAMIVVVSLSLSANLGAQFCPPPDVPTNAAPAEQSSAGLFVRGMGYLESNCLLQARVLLEAALKLEEPSPTVRLALALRLLRAREALAMGREDEALGELRTIVRELPSDVVKSAVETLAQLLSNRPNDPDWEILEPQLADLGSRGYTYADLLLRDHQAANVGPAKAAVSLEAALKQEQRPQRVLMLQTLLADLYVRTGRHAEAALLIASLEREVGESLLDLRGRVRFLEVGTRVWRARVDAGVPGNENRLRAYETALMELRQVVGR